MNLKKISITLITASFLLPAATSAQDRIFARTYQTNVLNPGSIDIEFWTTSRYGKEDRFFHRLDQRLEFEMGVAKNIQTAFYFNTKIVNEDIHVPIEPEPHQHAGVEHTEVVSSSEVEFGFSNEWKFKLTDPVANALGTALYFEWGLMGREVELETKILLDKVIGKNVIAFNGVYEAEFEGETEENKSKLELHEHKLEADLAYMNLITNRFGLGLEVVNHNEIAESEWEHSALFAGPSFHFNGKNWFINLNVLPQVTALKKSEGAVGNLVLDEHEKVETRILFAITF